MVISYFGKQYFKISQGDTVIAINPPSREVITKEKMPKFGADIVLISARHPDYNGPENSSFGDRSPFVISGPGEYEVKGISISGFGCESMIGGKKIMNTAYLIDDDNLKLCFLGAMSKDLSLEGREGLGIPDIVFVPAGKNFLGARDAYKIAMSLEPKMIIPVDCDDVDIKAFLKEAGEEKIKPEEKLTIKKKDLEGKEGEIFTISVA